MNAIITSLHYLTIILLIYYLSDCNKSYLFVMIYIYLTDLSIIQLIGHVILLMEQIAQTLFSSLDNIKLKQHRELIDRK